MFLYSLAVNIKGGVCIFFLNALENWVVANQQ